MKEIKRLINNMLFLYNEALNIVWILIGVLVICLIVFLLRKFVPGLQGEEIEEDEKKIAEENIKRKIVEFKENENDENEEN